MIIIFYITLGLIILYMIYPVWLSFYVDENPDKKIEVDKIKSVSLILLSFNGKKYLKEKIAFLIQELSAFENYEIIIIDDNSSDGSKEFLNEYNHRKKIKIITKNERKGIPHSMNIGVNSAKYDYIIFCDQRQKLSDNILQNLVEPLKYKNIGAVSGCICHYDKEKKYSFLRKHENFIKSKESKDGILIGVYGPFYAIKKSCYSVIPKQIILDDLYLSLKILKTKKIVLIKSCRIVDDKFSVLYNFKRSKRYLRGLLQILIEKELVGNLCFKLKLMLIWHKYLRLLIPPFLFFSYISLALISLNEPFVAVLFIAVTILITTSTILSLFKFYTHIGDLVRTNIFYFISMISILFHKFFTRSQKLIENKGTVEGGD